MEEIGPESADGGELKGRKRESQKEKDKANWARGGGSIWQTNRLSVIAQSKNENINLLNARFRERQASW